MPGNGPLPDPNRRRRNAPTIPTTNLPASGPNGDPPALPSWMELRRSGQAWWAWAWTTPQACAWGMNVGMEAVVARRASLEDDLFTLERVVDTVDLTDLPVEVKAAVQRIASMASGRLALMREMRELDDRLGLTPKGLAALRWTIVEDTPAADASPPPNVPSLSDRRARLTSAS